MQLVAARPKVVEGEVGELDAQARGKLRVALDALQEGRGRESSALGEPIRGLVDGGGVLSLPLIGEDESSDRFTVSHSLDGESWTEVWSRVGSGAIPCRVDLDPHLEVKRAPAKYTHFVRIELLHTMAAAGTRWVPVVKLLTGNSGASAAPAAS